MADSGTGYDQDASASSIKIPAGVMAQGMPPEVARQIEKRKVRAYQSEVDAANKAYDKWNTDYDCDKLEGYYTGLDHWPEEQRGNYTINLCYGAMETRMPSLMFYNPKARVKPKPARADDPMTAIDDRAKLLEDLADSFIQDDKVSFYDATQIALKEAHYRFGIVQVGYTADYIDNPNVGKPMLDDGKEPMVDSNGQNVMEGPYLIREESLFVKHIPADHCRVPVNAKNKLEHNDWFAYYEFVPIGDVRQNPRYENTDQVKSTARMRKEYEETYYDADDAEERRNKRNDMVKLWKCWDLRTMTYYVWPDGAPFFLVGGEEFKFLPIADLRFHQLISEFYPLPPMKNWVSPQDELNETRQMQRVHRRRFKRRYMRLRNFCSQAEWDKLEQGDDGTCVEVNNLDGIRPVEDAALDPAVARNIPNTREDFMRVSGVGGDQQNVPESETATQAQIIDTNLRIRESFARAQVGKWLSKIIKLMIMTARDRMALPYVIERNVDPLGPAAGMEVLRVASTWAAITHEDLGEFDFDVSVDLESMSPTTMDQERQKWMQTLGMLMNPQMAILLSGSEVLLRKTLEFNGIRSARDVGEIRQAMQATAIAMAMQQGMGAGPGGPPGKPGAGPGAGPRKPAINPSPAPGPTPGRGDIMSQVAAQLGMTGPSGGRMN